MPSVDRATQIFSILSDLVLSDHLSKHFAYFPLTINCEPPLPTPARTMTAFCLA